MSRIASALAPASCRMSVATPSAAHARASEVADAACSAPTRLGRQASGSFWRREALAADTAVPPHTERASAARAASAQPRSFCASA